MCLSPPHEKTVEKAVHFAGLLTAFRWAVLPLLLLLMSALTWGDVTGQTVLGSIPEADENAIISVCAGSTVLFSDNTPAGELSGTTTFTWSFGVGDGANTAGPHAIVYPDPGTYEVELTIVTLDGESNLGSSTLTVEVGEAPDLIPTLGIGNPCTVMIDTLGTVVFQTLNGDAGCTCTVDAGPAISILDTDQYPDGTISQVWWGGAGILENGGTSAYTEQSAETGTSFPTFQDSINVFNGQGSPAGHYSSQGSYDLVHVVQFPDGCVYSSYYVMSWGAALIDFGANNAQSVCYPLGYELSFGSQSPGTTYAIDWGDGEQSSYTYPDLPISPNVVEHGYNPSCSEVGVAEGYEITVVATNFCPNDTTENVQGPYYVSTAPQADFTADPGLAICQFETIAFTQEIETGFQASGGSCTDEHIWAWSINGSSNLTGFGYEVIGGQMGDLVDVFNIYSGSESINVSFNLPGTYGITMTVQNEFCFPTDITKIVVVNPVPIVDDLDLTICDNQSFDTIPNAPPNIVPLGTIFSWTVTDNPNVVGDNDGFGTSISAALVNLTNVTQIVEYIVTPTAPPDCVGDPFVMTVEVVPGIEIPDVELVVCNGEEIIYQPVNGEGAIVPSGTTYTWTYTDNPNVEGEESNLGSGVSDVSTGSLVTDVILLAQSVDFQVVASAGLGCNEGSFDMTVWVNALEPGAISESQIVCSGGDPELLEFSAVYQTSGTPTLQWESAPSPLGNWVPIAGATDATYDPPSGITDDTYFRVVVTSTLLGTACTATTNIVVVEVNYIDQPIIGTGHVICEGGNPSEMFILSGTDAFGDVSFQWQSASNELGPWVDIPDATALSYDPPPGLLNDAWYRLIVTSNAEDVACFRISEPVLVDVNSVNPGFITSSQTICEGEIPNPLEVQSESVDGTVGYSWYVSNSLMGPFVPVESNQGAYTPPEGLIEDTFYQVEVSSALNGVLCSEWTNVIHVTVNNFTPPIGQVVQNICAGDDPMPLELLEVPTSDGALSYQWLMSNDLVSWTPIDGATMETYDPPNAVLQDTWYSIEIQSELNGVVCSLPSVLFEVNVDSIDGGSLSADAEICFGGDPDSLFFMDNPSGEGSLSYQWQSATAPSGPWVDIPGATALVYDPPGPLLVTTYYQVVVSSLLGEVSCSVLSGSSSIAVLPDPEIVVNPIPFQVLCEGAMLDVPLEVNGSAGLGDLTYQWYDNDGLIAGAVDSLYMPAVFNAEGVFEFYTVVSWSGIGCDAQTSELAEISIIDDPVVAIEPDASFYCQAATSDSIYAEVEGGVGAASYQWFINDVDSNSGGVLISGATGSAIAPSTADIGMFYYYCLVTLEGVGCEAVSNVVSVEISVGPSIVSALDDQIVCLGGVLDAWTILYEDGIGVPSYQWYESPTPSLGDATAILGATLSEFTAPSDEEGSMYYTCEISYSSGGCEELVAPFVLVEVVPDPSVSLQPLPTQELCVGGGLEVPLEVSFSGGVGTATYTWFEDDQLILDSNSATFDPADYTTTGAFAYDVEISFSGSGCESVFSDEATVVVLEDPVLADEPIDAVYCSGAMAEPLFVGVEGGSGVAQFQWFSNVVQEAFNGDLIAGATNATFTPNTDAVGELFYYCEVQQLGANCQVTSIVVSIAVLPDPIFSIQPQPDSVCVGGAIDALSVAYEQGFGIPSYQWFSNSVPSVSGATPIPGATVSTYLPDTDEVGSTWYFCELSLTGVGCDLIVSDIVSIVVTPSPLIGADPLATDTLCVGGTMFAPLEVDYLNGTGTASYQWFDGTDVAIAGATSSSYWPPSFTTPGTYNYYATISLSGSGCDAATSVSAEVLVVEDPLVTLDSLSFSYCEGAFPVEALQANASGGTGLYSYQWYENTAASNSGGTLIAGATGSDYIPSVGTVGTLHYYCVVTQTGANCEVVSTYATIETNASPAFTMNPQSQTLCFGESVGLLEVAYAFGTGTPSYQWFVNGMNDYVGANAIAGETSPTYLPPVDATGSLYYYCSITFDIGGCSEILSAIAGIHVNNIVIGEIAMDQAICYGEIPESLSESLATSGIGVLAYQWLSSEDFDQDHTPIVGAALSTYQAPVLYDTTYYVLEVSSILNGIACIDTTNSVEIIVYPLPEISLGASDVYCGNNGIVELTEFSPVGGVWEGPGVVDSSLGLFDVAGTQTGVGEWDLIFWFEDLVTACRDTLDHVVTVEAVPVADFTVPNLACNNSPIDIIQNSTGAVSAVWDMGNATVLDALEPQYTYPDAGDYLIEMIVVNEAGCLDTLEQQTEITYPPVAGLSIPVDEGCAPFIATFENNSNAPFSTFEWMLGDSLVIQEFPDPALFAQGDSIVNYLITLEVSNLCGSDMDAQEITVIPLPEMSFVLLQDTACSPFVADILNTSVGLPEDIQWDFGNGQMDNGAEPYFPTYTVDSLAQVFMIELVGTNVCGVDSFSAPIFVEPNTVQSFFTLDVDEGCAPLEVTATDLSVGTNSIAFDFGNGLVEYDSISSVIYDEAGQFFVTQYVTNGCSLDTAAYLLDVWPQPEFELLADQDSYCEGETAFFELQSDQLITASWDFGQGAVGFGTEVSSSYDAFGIYDVLVGVTSGVNGCQISEQFTVSINPTPELFIDPMTDGGCSPLEVDFSNQSTDVDIWMWDFGDDSGAVVAEPNHVFINSSQEPLEVTVDVTASNFDGCAASETFDLLVLPIPNVEIGGIEEQYCGTPALISPANNSQFALEYTWWLNADPVSVLEEPTLIVDQAGSFDLMLIGTNEYGCTHSDVQSVVVYQSPIPALNIDPLTGCSPLEVNVQDVSVGSVVTELIVSNGSGVLFQGPVPGNPLLLAASGFYTIGAIVESAVGCIGVDSSLALVDVWPRPEADFIAVPYDSDGFDLLNPSSINDAWTFQNNSSDNEQNYWQFGDGAFSSEISPSYQYGAPGVYAVSLTVANLYGCFGSHVEWIKVDEDVRVYVPNAFTPGGMETRPDGVNDAFRAEFSDYSLIEEYSLQIFDRWGELVWESSDPEEYWLGNVRREGQGGDHFVNLDVYLWRIRFTSVEMNEQRKELSGHVTIVR